MRVRRMGVLAVLFGFLAGAVELSAHHGVVAYDTTRTETVTGTVTNFLFVNPHVLVFFEVEGEDGTVVEWSAGMTSPNRLARGAPGGVRWTRDTLQPGDQITVTGNPTHSGEPSLWVRTIVDGSGTALIGGE